MALPLLAAAVPALIGAGGALIGGAAGVGKEAAVRKSFDQSGLYNSDAKYFGGNKQASAEEKTLYHQRANEAQQRQGEQLGLADYRQDRNRSTVARAMQWQQAKLMSDRARGLVPSIAQMQADRQMQQAQAAQASQMASARGAGGMALAQQNAANNVANMQSDISGQAQINAANERLAAEQAAFAAYGGVRQGDQAQGQMSAQVATEQARINAQQRQQNDAYSMANREMAFGINKMNQDAAMRDQEMLQGSFDGANHDNQERNRRNAEREMKFMDKITGAMTSAAGGMMGVGAKASGGPVQPGQPYLVGERGPELVMPTQAATVIPAHQTAGLLGAPRPRARPMVMPPGGLY